MEKDIFNIDKTNFHMVGDMSIPCSIILSGVQNTEKGFKNGIDTECEEMLQNLAEEYKFQILAMEVMPDHIHLLVDCKPQFYISDMIKIMKGNLARQMFLAYPELKKELWGGHLWNPSYCAITVSDRSRDQVLAYIEGQKEKEKKKA
jgi:Transposase and inactivated derivatives